MAVKAQVLIGGIGAATRSGAALPIIGSKFKLGAYQADITSVWACPLVMPTVNGASPFWRIIISGGPAFIRFSDAIASRVAPTNNGANQTFNGTTDGDILVPEGIWEFAGNPNQVVGLIAAA